MTQVAIAILLFGTVIFGIGLWAAKALHVAQARHHRHEDEEMSRLGASHTLGRSA
jgi:hypothetical protein